MQLEDNQDADKVGSAVKHPKGEKLSLTKVEKSTKNFLCETFTPMDNEDRKDLRSQFIVPDTPFTTPPHLDKLMAVEFSKSVKSADHLHSHIQALFLDTVGPLTGLLDDINKDNQIAVEDVEAAVKVALTFMGSASSHCNTKKRTLVLRRVQ